MSLQTCIREARKWADENSELKLSSKEIGELGQILNAAKEAGQTVAEQKKLMQDAVLRRIEATQQANRGESTLNSIKHVQNATNISKNVELWGNTPAAPADAIEAHTTGLSSRPGYGVNNDPLAASRGNMTRFMGYLENALSKPELKIFKSLQPGDDLTGKIYQELDALRQKTELGQSGSDLALSIAKKFREAQDAMFKDAQAVNPYLKENALYLASRSHNRALVKGMTQEAWVALARESFGNGFMGSDEEVTKFLGESYKAIKAGLPPEGLDKSPRFWEPRGTGGSQAMQSAGQRVFVANDWKAEFNYNAQCGDSLYNSYAKQAERWGDYVANTNKWGTKGADNFKRLFDAVYKTSDTAQKEMLLKRKAGLQEKFEATQASRSNEAWTIQGRAAQGLIAAENLSMLGNHVPRTLGSGVAMLSQIRDGYGLNIFQRATSVAQTLGRFMGNLGDAGQKAMGEWGVSSMSVSRDMANQIAAGNGTPLGVVGKASRLLGKLSLADYATNAWKYGMAENDTRLLGRAAATPFENLPSVTQELLRRYNLGDQRWNIARQFLDSDGRMTPEGFRAIPDEALKDLAGKASATEAMRVRGELAQNLGTLLNDRASMTVAESNASSRAIAYGTSDINTAQGIARNFFYQFHQASIVRQQLLARTWRSGGGNTSNISGSLQYMLGMAFAGMVGQQLIEMGAGREPLDITDPKIVGHMIRGTGLMGYYGDILADYVTAPDANKMKSFVEGDFLGPSFGSIVAGGEAAFRTGHGIVQGLEGKERQNQYGQQQWARLLHSLTPGQNIFYAKGGLDYLLFNEAHEFLGDHGYVGHLRRQMQQSHNIVGDHQQYTFGGQNAWE
jgi:hypothetical protein